MSTSDVSSHFCGRVSLCSSLVDLILTADSKESLLASVGCSNSIAFETVELKKKLTDVREKRDNMNENIEWLRWCLFRLAEAQKQFTAVSDNIMSLNSVPKVVNRAGNGEASTSIAAAAGEGGRGSGEAERKGGADQESNSRPVVSCSIIYPTASEFEQVPKYLRGRLQYTAFQTAIDEFNGALKDKYTFLQPGFGSLKSLANKKKYKVRVTAKFYVDLKNAMKSYESADSKGYHFVVADDLKNCSSLKYESSRRTLFSVLRHTKKVTEIRGPGNILRYAAVPKKRQR